ncbi:MFS transporter [Marinobacter confluentis]|uniref:MFS transporter n=1 Tax=Marinobacter confluentis TaxID=1697557 RepID=A0A4Z1C8X9_9GAMM|nr:MFS transporter [Marinobacter confluentis]TGN39508.1 MFS transporter [Marinobacter confluentis]
MLTGLQRAAFPLAIAQTLTWASLYYSFPALLPTWQGALGWSKSELSGAFTLALVLSSVAAPLAGTLIDRGYGRVVLAGGMILGALLLMALPAIREVWQFYLLWAGIGLAMSACLYEACFTVITRIIGGQAREAITVVTLLGGFAGTLAFPAAHLMAEAYDWQTAVRLFAGVVLFISVPFVIYGVTCLGPFAETSAASKSGTSGRIMAQPTFWMLGMAFCAIGLAHGAILTHLLFILQENGLPAWLAVLVVSMIGPMQVVGRVFMMLTAGRVSTFGVAVACYSLMIVATAALLATRLNIWMAFVFVALHGAGYGVASIVRPVMTAELLGRQSFGTVFGMLAIPFMMGFAIGPTAAALTSELAGYETVIVGAGVILACGLVAVFAARRMAPVSIKNHAIQGAG